MTRGLSDRAGGAHQPALDVVAGLVPGSAAAHVARAAVREAAARGARVRFVQVLEPAASEAERDDNGASTFAAALKALRETSRVPVSFEIAVGEPGEVLSERSRSAGLLVIGDDDGCSRSDVVRYCRAHAGCDVLCAAPATAGAGGGRAPGRC
ncbi:universal stress protein [Mobilicoccus pelagius]|uniref:UspA domain-containing protein n=1 Tax=Mobilicoccus pelagius NBRC 104925 TaxID=1089455 RepID=H5UQ40_9MICO|nr:universal stress protein [Mobilicoccus pelagius]GAB47845.1 hypothetical protein MOPEL_029_01270 [Mobilicoccus pelagius NBRC 104925]